LRVRIDGGVVPRALPKGAVVVDELPARAAVIGAVEPAFFGFNNRVDAIGIGGRRHADPAPDSRWQAVARQLLPGAAAVGRPIEAAARAAAFHDPWLAVRLPHRRIDDVG